MANLNEQTLKRILDDVLAKLSTGGATPGQGGCGCAKNAGGGGSAPSVSTPVTGDGVFEDVNAAAAAAHTAFEQLRKGGYATRRKIVNIVKKMCAANAETWGKLEFAETKVGRLEHKIAKLQGIPSIPGVEWIEPYGMSGDNGIAMEEFTPFGVIGVVTPVTHSIPTIACNIINMVAAGNTLLINPHPNGARCAAEAVRAFNQAFARETGIRNIATIIPKPTLESFNAIAKAEQVRLLCITGGPGVVAAAMKSGKRAICAGPGNPPVVVDETAHIEKAARDIIDGAAFDNNLLCIGEKQVFVTDKAWSAFLAAFEKAGAVKINSGELERLTAEAFTMSKDAGGCSHPVLNRKLVGADAHVLARAAGRTVSESTRLLFAETSADHAFVIEEQMMPMVPVIRARDFEHAVQMAYVSEHGYKHSSMVHTLNVERMTYMAKALDSTVFVKNGSCLAGLGSGGEGYPSFSIATTTGEGITTPMTFTRKRRCVMVNNLNIF